MSLSCHHGPFRDELQPTAASVYSRGAGPHAASVFAFLCLVPPSRLLEKDGRFADVHIEGRAGGLVSVLLVYRLQNNSALPWTDRGGFGELGWDSHCFSALHALVFILGVLNVAGSY